MIGIFDSGLGGLSAYKELRALRPEEDYLYFGDTGRVPYGTRSKATLEKYTRQDIAFLRARGVDAILAACGTVSSVVLDDVKDEYDLPIFGVVDAAADAAVAATKNEKIGVLGTGATISSRAFERKIRAKDPDALVVARACPLFVPLVENGYVARDCEVTRLVARDYLADVKAAGVDTLILGCTHFPLIADIIADLLPKVTLINAGAAAAHAVARALPRRADTGGSAAFFVSDDPANFDEVARIFLGGDTISAEKVDIDTFAAEI
ncbi:MAG: glutamate racemase [Clostridia bacterium]|nr:glutamate racemase [Clostridia bacterium]